MLTSLASSLGADLRSLRKARGLTLEDVAEALDRSVGWLSQVERDMSEPGINDLRRLAKLYDVAMSSLFRAEAKPGEEGRIVRSDNRRPIGSREAGLVEELLSPDLTDDFEMVRSVFEPGSGLTEAVVRETQEVGYIISGRLQVTIQGTSYDLNPGDSFRVRGEPFLWANPWSDPCVAIWVIAPPVY